MAVQPDVLISDPSDLTVARSVQFLESLFADCPERNFQVRFWNGHVWRAGSRSAFTLVLNHPGALRRMLSASELELGEAYIFNDIDIEGDIEASFQVGDFLLGWGQRPARDKLRLGAMISKLPQAERPRAAVRPKKLRGLAHSKTRDRLAISYHYDLPPQFYSLFLGSSMSYSSGYFRNAEDTLDQSQQQKLDYICRKLRLHPGESFLDVGCGWGSLIVFAAKHYGIRSCGITLSAPQAEFARKLIQAEGVEALCQVRLCDYRELRPATAFDKVASIGMFEHVGERFLPGYFRQMSALLRPGGAFLNSGIAASATYRKHGPSFIDEYVFPDGELVPINTALKAAESIGLEVRDVENLREHYAATLHLWVERLEEHAHDATRLADEVTYRIWRLYMAGSAHAFRNGRLHLYQTLLTKPEQGAPSRTLTREEWYSPQLEFKPN